MRTRPGAVRIRGSLTLEELFIDWAASRSPSSGSPILHAATPEDYAFIQSIELPKAW